MLNTLKTKKGIAVMHIITASKNSVEKMAFVKRIRTKNAKNTDSCLPMTKLAGRHSKRRD